MKSKTIESKCYHTLTMECYAKINALPFKNQAHFGNEHKTKYKY